MNSPDDQNQRASKNDLPCNANIIDFGEIHIGQESSLELSVANNGTTTLDVSNIEVSGDAFSVSSTYLSVETDSTENLMITFMPQSLGLHEAIITFYSNDPSNPETSINFSGTGVNPPVIDVTPELIDMELFSGEVDTSQVITISNSGGSNLNWNLNIEFMDSTDNSSDRELGDVISSHYSNLYESRGMVWVEDVLYAIDNYTLFKYTFSDTTLMLDASYNLNNNSYGITYDGEYLWIGTNSGQIRAYSLDGNDQNISFQSPVYDENSLTFDGEYFIVNDYNQNNPSIYRIDYDGNVVSTYYMNFNRNDLYQSVWVEDHNDGSLWTVTQDNTIIQISLTDNGGDILQEFQIPGYNDYGYAITHDGTDLWSLCWFQREKN